MYVLVLVLAFLFFISGNFCFSFVIGYGNVCEWSWNKRKRKNTCDKTLTTTYIWSVTVQCRACLHEGGGPQVGEVTCDGLPHLSCKCDHIKRRDCMDRRVTPPKRVTSPTWGPPPPCKQALNYVQGSYLQVLPFPSSRTLTIKTRLSAKHFLWKRYLHKTKTPFSYQ